MVSDVSESSVGCVGFRDNNRHDRFIRYHLKASDDDDDVSSDYVQYSWRVLWRIMCLV